MKRMLMTESTTHTSGERSDLIQVGNQVKYYPVHGGVFRRVVAWVKAVDDVSFTSRKERLLAWLVNRDAARPLWGTRCSA